ncbi:hypothetical protein QS468_46545 [Bacillus subtilis]|nr:hypothetical protein [Pseudomonas sp. A29(2023)]MDL5600242.1 hypothetical protein [Bacillus subtilis]
MIEDRLRFLVRHLGATRLAGVTAIERRRWQTVATNYAVKPRVEDLEALIQAFPQYDLWLWRGQSDPENGQLAPDTENMPGTQAPPVSPDPQNLVYDENTYSRNAMAEGVTDRVLHLLNLTSLKDLAEVNSKEYVRWQSIKRGNARLRADDLEKLSRFYPQFRWWLLTGEVLPEAGQTRPIDVPPPDA